jgi:hypothetical protein
LFVEPVAGACVYSRFRFRQVHQPIVSSLQTVFLLLFCFLGNRYVIFVERINQLSNPYHSWCAATQPCTYLQSVVYIVEMVELLIKLGAASIASLVKLCQLTSYSALEQNSLTFRCYCSRTLSRGLHNRANIILREALVDCAYF